MEKESVTKSVVFKRYAKDCHSQYKQAKHDLSFSGGQVILTIVYTFQTNNVWSSQRYKRNVDWDQPTGEPGVPLSPGAPLSPRVPYRNM